MTCAFHLVDDLRNARPRHPEAQPKGLAPRYQHLPYLFRARHTDKRQMLRCAQQDRMTP